MSEVQCFCGELVSSLEDLVTHTIYSHTIEDRHSIDPRVFDMIEIENKKVKTEDGIEDIGENGFDILKTMDSIAFDMIETTNKKVKTKGEVVETKVRENDENLIGKGIMNVPFHKNALEPPPSIKYESIVVDAAELSSMIYENPDPLKISTEEYSTVRRQNIMTYNICQAKFTLFHNLNKHKRIVHKESNPFSCNACKLSFPTHQLLKNHLMIHSGEKPVSCNECRECNFSFSTPGLTKDHMTIHTGKTYFPCPQCSCSFSSRIDLNIHVKKRHAKKHANESKPENIELKKSVMGKPLTASKMKNNIYLPPKLKEIKSK